MPGFGGGHSGGHGGFGGGPRGSGPRPGGFGGPGRGPGGFGGPRPGGFGGPGWGAPPPRGPRWGAPPPPRRHFRWFWGPRRPRGYYYYGGPGCLGCLLPVIGVAALVTFLLILIF